MDAELGYRLGGAFDLEPIVGVQWTQQERDGYIERGAGALNLSVSEHSTDSDRGLLGLRAHMALGERERPRTNAEVRVSVAHEFGCLLRGTGRRRPRPAVEPD